MSDVAIKVEGLSKRYHLGQYIGGAYQYRTLREVLTDAMYVPFRRLRARIKRQAVGSNPTTMSHQPSTDFIWALNDVSFEVKQGEVVGIIGRNGAGKTTLLKVLSRITEPTKGRAEIKGRLGSLLEVGTGFHPELTGRENIYLSGAILGMTKKEIDRKFDEIVDFSGIEKFIDTPVKRYSSGMLVRLGFAVAAHLEPEILLVDEVLAVGDAGFQKKCLGKMGDVAKEGRTVLFVSHNMRAVRQLCERVIWLNEGMICANGHSDEVVKEYLEDIPQAETLSDIPTLIRQLPPDPAFRLESITLLQDGRLVERHVLSGQPMEIVIRYEVLEKTTGLRVFFDLMDNEETLLFRSFHDEDGDGIPTMKLGHYVSKVVIPANFLAPTNYELRVLATVYNVRMCIPYPGVRIPLKVEATGRANRAYVGDPIRGKLAPVIPWITFPAQEE